MQGCAIGNAQRHIAHKTQIQQLHTLGYRWLRLLTRQPGGHLAPLVANAGIGRLAFVTALKQ